MVDNFYADYPNTREVPVMIPAALTIWNYYDVSKAFRESGQNGVIKNVVRVPVLVISKDTRVLSDKKAFNASNRCGLYDAVAYSCLWGYKLVPYSKQTALIKACSGNCPIYDFERIELCDSRFVRKYKSAYYLSGTSSKFEKKFFLLLFDRRSDAVKVLKKTLEVFRKIFDLLGANFSFYQTRVIHSLIEYMYNPTALFTRKLIGLRWCRVFVGGLLKGVVDASELSTEFLIGKDFEIVRWN
jgi:hypothetical protein